MEKLDPTYVTELVRKAGRGESNAFAELFAAVYQRPYAYLHYMLGDWERAEELLRTVFVRTLEGLPSLNAPALFLPWLARICCRVCEEEAAGDAAALPAPEDVVKTPAGAYTAAQLGNLPLTESQLLLMCCAQGLTGSETGDLLNLSRGMVKRGLRSACRHLRNREEAAGEEPGRPTAHRLEVRSLSARRAADLLEAVFDAQSREPNTVPVEVLSSYTIYRRERFSLQRGVLTAALALFLLLPVLFVLPACELSVGEAGLRKLPVVSIRVRSLLPVRRVTAKLAQHALPVYEAGAKAFTVEPTRNGALTVTVELLNRQKCEVQTEMTTVDSEGPRLTGSEIGEDTVLLWVEDAGIGVNFRDIMCYGTSGETIRPLEIREETGEVIFAYPEEDWDVYIPDHIGNMLHLSLTLD